MLASSTDDEEVMQSQALRVELPEELCETFFRESGYSPTTADEKRRRARLAVRREAKITFANLPNRYQEDPDEELCTLVKDLSRGGIAILYHEQIFPEDVFRVYFQSRAVTALAVRCRKLGPKCYEIGARVLDATRLTDHTFEDNDS
ncbi:MAG: hypothetical protein Aurels2KO_11550 [Aureliella sp.]